MPISLLRLLPLLLVWRSVWAYSSTEDEEDHERPVIYTKDGQIRGKIIRLTNGQEVAAFLGVRYAEPPVGKLRFKDPVPVHRWDGELDASSFGPLCPQSRNRSHWDVVRTPRGGRVLRRLGLWDYAQGEDCLNLNIYVPKEDLPPKDVRRDPRLPILVFLHGGSYKTNGGRFYPGEWLSSKGKVVVITLNYRLGVLGFLSTEDEGSHGNFGLRDQLCALRWVRKHALAIGGDEKRITLLGNSAGGACVGLHLLSPEARGLFRRVVLQSGSPLGEWAVQRRPKIYAQRLGTKLGCSDKSSGPALVECLRTIDAQTLVDKSEDASLEDSLMLQFAPSVDGLFLPRPPEELLRKEGALGPSPTPEIIVGITRDELEVWMTKSYQDRDPEKFPFTREILRKYLLHLVRRERLSTQAADVLLHAVYTEYVHGNDGRDGALPDIRTLGKIISDIDLKAPSVRLVDLLSMHPGTSVFFYEFGYASTDDVIATKYVGSYHESELYYLFGFPHLGLDNALRLKQDREVSDLLIQLWTDFAKYGEPTPSKVSSHFKWPPYDNVGRSFAQLQPIPTISRSYESERMTFWNRFVPLITEHPLNIRTANISPEPCGTAALAQLLIVLLIASIGVLACTCCVCCCYGGRRPFMGGMPVPV